MHSTQAGTGPATAAPRRIRADHLQLVLVALRMQARYCNADPAQLAARSGCLPLVNACRRTKRPLTNFDARSAMTPSCTPMWVSDIDDVISRTQRDHGALEVRRIWGRPVKTLLSKPAAQLDQPLPRRLARRPVKTMLSKPAALRARAQ